MYEPAVDRRADTPALEVRRAFKRFPRTDWVLAGVDLAVRPGELLCVLGPSGCGKTTLLRVICGFEKPDHGEVVQRGRVISRPERVLAPEKRRIGMVFQDYAMFPHLTVRGNVRFGLEPSLRQRLLRRLGGRRGRGLPVERRIGDLLALTGLTGLEDRYPHELSGGQQQRVALARALAPDPALILLDEPFSNLDTTLRQRLRQEVRSVLKRAGTTSILVTHDQEEAINLADRIAVMNNGRMEQVGTPEEVLHAPQTRFVATFIGLNNLLPGRIGAGGVETELGVLPLPEGQQWPPGMDVEVLLRPDYWQYSDNGHGTPARVARVDYLGVQRLYTLTLPSGRHVQALLPGYATFAPGEQTCVAFHPPRVVLFPT